MLHKLLLELYPNKQTRPKIIGPDIHGFHSGDFSSTASSPFLRKMIMIDQLDLVSAVSCNDWDLPYIPHFGEWVSIYCQ